MRLLTSLSSWTKLAHKQEVAVTIGNFDGVHLGHQALLSKLENEGVERLAITFSNSPSELLHKESPPQITSFEKRIELLTPLLDTLIAIPFTKKLSLMQAETFLSELQEKIPFKRLVLGNDATLGHHQDGNRTTLVDLSEKLGFEMVFVAPTLFENRTISSSLIRKWIQSAEFDKAKSCLGRPFTFQGRVIRGSGRATRELGFPTLNLNPTGYLHPPLGVYAIECRFENRSYLGIANLGYAPTLRAAQAPLLEIHLFDFNQTLYDKTIEVIFLSFIRNEKRFDSVDALKKQIESDITTVRNFSVYSSI